MQIQDVELVISAVAPMQYPTDGLPEIALTGRSNVGKSSMINKLIQRKKMARTSSTPGKTQTLNFYKLNDAFYFVDVPGYGYAKVSKKDRESFSQMIETYLQERDNLRGVISLIDVRHEPTKDDLAMYKYLQFFGVPVLVVATKGDKVPRGKWNQRESKLKKALELNQTDDLVVFSSTTGIGGDQIWQWVEEHLAD
ncbi:ribosome biogenesis GTP-binding protein YihA/YsxC [Loigolactobacillus coryniformis]|jgi:GTP-binding protein|uniref:Probable GTP-binding protein EngB n=3 Tax=Loigolactobacillus coryniformis TaxID=1610 RepID=J3EQQ4_9LACO|nr:ribosome biogenesis GTP-binding protein YihA/YsxC [Loigolactobacillus coryniformis]ATO43627.1 YihA family ribosome biogenesis GTP-binding protein [Loigolactobacillus coryniformis subsp. torquens DSM 20004 = KCTC 3535]ATO55310.1 YihA family ribosome biogenesis GTP-binding protein [Loigolactobacillus coryniformis subsp. coryniformis KCTC 3167 = DSM 20001]EJN55770.1 Putative GTP-binding protein EngB [Loigolactobacillus coryniformis subsp. coryniformis CECT 5711]KRK15545.1 GTP-binding protein Ys